MRIKGKPKDADDNKINNDTEEQEETIEDDDEEESEESDDKAEHSSLEDIVASLVEKVDAFIADTNGKLDVVTNFVELGGVIREDNNDINNDPNNDNDNEEDSDDNYVPIEELDLNL